MAKSILLTGATGFLGSHLLDALLNDGHEVVILKRSTSDTWRIGRLLERVKSYDVDKMHIEKAFEDQRIDAVIHTACHYGRNTDSLSKVLDSNLMFGLRLLEVAMSFNVDSFFNTDTMLQRNLNSYTISKKQFVEWLSLLSDKIKVVNFRLEHMYGPMDDKTKFVSWIISQFEQQVDEIKLTKGEQLRDFIYIDDVVSAYLIVLDKTSQLDRFSEFDVGTGTLTSVRAFVESLKSAYEKKTGVCKTMLSFGVLPYRTGEMMSVKVDNSKIMQLGWSAKTLLAEGIGKSIEKQQ